MFLRSKRNNEKQPANKMKQINNNNSHTNPFVSRVGLASMIHVYIVEKQTKGLKMGTHSQKSRQSFTHSTSGGKGDTRSFCFVVSKPICRNCVWF